MNQRLIFATADKRVAEMIFYAGLKLVHVVFKLNTKSKYVPVKSLDLSMDKHGQITGYVYVCSDLQESAYPEDTKLTEILTEPQYTLLSKLVGGKNVKNRRQTHRSS